MISATVNLYKNAYTGLNHRMWLLAVVMLINRAGTMVLPFMTLYCKHIGYTTKQAGWVVAIYGLGSMVGAFLGGRISDRFGFYYTQFFSLLCGGLLFITLGQMNSYISICICTFFLSMVNESFRPANATAIAHYSTVQNRTQSFSVVRLAINIGWGLGGAMGGFLASINYHLLFWVDGFTNITAAFLLLWLLPKVSLAQQQNKPKEKTAVIRSVSAYADKTFLYFIGLQVLFAICFFQLFTTIPLYFKEGLHINEFWIGVVMAMNGILIAIFEMVIVFKLEGKRPYLLLMTYGTILMGFSFFILNIPLISGFLIAVLSTVMVTFAEMIAMPFMNSYYISRSTEGNRGQYAALYVMAWSVAQVIGSTTGTLIAYAAGFNNLWWMIGGISLLTAAGYHSLYKKG
ncbi:MAG TPA: MFS transporter [Ferruginibacter sp.]|nr:MFS transporter [Ferruginibacter sp.]